MDCNKLILVNKNKQTLLAHVYNDQVRQDLETDAKVYITRAVHMNGEAVIQNKNMAHQEKQ